MMTSPLFALRRRGAGAVAVRVLAIALVLAGAAGAAAAKSFVLPHVLERYGRISNTPFTFDTTITVQYPGGVACVGGTQQDAPVALFLYDDNTQPMRGLDGSEVCNPCTATLNADQRKVAFNLETLLAPSGGLVAAKTGFGIVVVGGSAADYVHVEGLIVNSHSSAFDVSVFGFDPIELRAAAKAEQALPCGRVFTIGRMMATGGAASDTPYSFETAIHMAYVAGLAGQPAGGGATVDIYLFDDATGEPLTDTQGAPVCYPCTEVLSHNKQDYKKWYLAEGSTGFMAAHAVLVVSGDADNVAIQPITVNRHSGPLDVSMFAPRLREITAATVSAVPAELAERLGLRSQPNPFNPLTTFSYTLPKGDRVQVRVFDAQGALVRTLLNTDQPAGRHEVTWDGTGDDGRHLPSGLYFGRVDGTDVRETRKVMMLK